MVIYQVTFQNVQETDLNLKKQGVNFLLGFSDTLSPIIFILFYTSF